MSFKHLRFILDDRRPQNPSTTTSSRPRTSRSKTARTASSRTSTTPLTANGLPKDDNVRRGILFGGTGGSNGNAWLRYRPNTPGEGTPALPNRAEELLNPATQAPARGENIADVLNEVGVQFGERTHNRRPPTATSSGPSAPRMAAMRSTPFGSLEVAEAAEYLSNRDWTITLPPITPTAAIPAEPRRLADMSVLNSAVEIIRRSGGTAQRPPRLSTRPLHPVCDVCGAEGFATRAAMEKHRDDHNVCPTCTEPYAESLLSEHRPHCSAAAVAGT